MLLMLATSGEPGSGDGIWKSIVDNFPFSKIRWRSVTAITIVAGLFCFIFMLYRFNIKNNVKDGFPQPGDFRIICYIVFILGCLLLLSEILKAFKNRT